MSQLPRISDAFNAARSPLKSVLSAPSTVFPAISGVSNAASSILIPPTPRLTPLPPAQSRSPFPTQIPQPPPILSIQAQATDADHFERLRKEREQMVDTKVMATRATTPKAAVEKRAVQRVSIKELNNLDFDAIRKKLDQSRFDERTPIVKILDLLELSRDVVFNIIAPATRDANRARGDIGSFGITRISASDILRELGVKNRVARAILGFVGDVVFDPITYLGPAAIGLKVSAKTAGASRTVLRISTRSKKGLFRGIRAAAESGSTSAIKNETVRNLIGTQVTDAAIQRSVKRFGVDRTAGSITRRIIGDTKKSTLDKIFRSPISSEGGILANRFFDIATIEGSQAAKEIDAVRAFVLGGDRSAIGLKFGRGGTQLLHIPFTSLNVQVPAFTAAGRTSILAKELGAASAFSSAGASATRDVLQRSERLLDAIQIEHAATNEERLRFARDKSVSGAIDSAATTGDSLQLGNIIKSLPLDEQADAIRGSVGGPVSIRDLHEAARQVRVAGREQRLENIVQLSKSIQRDSTLLSPAVDTQNALHLAKVRDISLHVLDRAQILKKRLSSTTQEGDLVRRIENVNRTIENIPTQTKTTDTLFGPFTETTAASSEKQIAENELNTIVSDIHQSIGSAQRLADSTGASLQTFLTSEEKEVIEVVKTALGTNDDTIGASLLMPVIDAARNIFGEESLPLEWARALDRAKRKVFGRKGGEVPSQRRFAERGQSQGAARAYSQATKTIERRLDVIAKKHDLAPTERDNLFHMLTAVLYSRREGSSANFYRMPWVEGIGPVTVEKAIELRGGGKSVSNFAVELEESRRSGLLANPHIRADLELAADELGEHVLDDIKIHAQQAGILGMSIEGYVNTILTKEGRDLVRTRRAALVRNGKSADEVDGLLDATSARERFQHHRTTTEYRFQDPSDGSWHRFNEFDRAFLETADTLSEDQQKIVDTISRFDELVAAGTPGIDDVGKQIDAFEFNSFVKNGRYAMLTGGKIPDEGFFESNFMTLIGSAKMQYERAESTSQFVRRMNVGTTTLPIDPIEFQLVREAGPGTTLTTRDGIKVRVLKPQQDKLQRVEVGGQIYRQLDDKIISKTNPLRQTLEDSKNIEKFHHEIVAENLERYAQLFNDETGTNPLAKASDFLVGRWRELTLFHPAWMATELIGNMALMVMAGVNPLHVTKHATSAIKLALNSNNPEKLRSIVFNLADGRTINGEEMLGMATQFFFDSSRGSETAAILHARLGVPLPGFGIPQPGGGTLRGSIRQTAERVKRIPQSVKTALAGKRVMEAGNDIRALSGGVVPHNDSLYRRFFGGWFRADALLNNSMRTMAFASFLEQGNDVASAGLKVSRTMLDMTDLTRTESQVARRFLMPFYSWIRLNTSYQMKQLFLRPAFAANFPRLRDRIEDGIDGDRRVPQYMRPAWMRDQLALQIGTNPDKRWAILLRSAVPIGDAFETMAGVMGIEGAQNFFQYYIGSANPVIKVPFEIAAGRDIFSRREIGPTTEQGDVSVKDFVLGQVRPIKETGIGIERKGAIPRAFGQGFGSGVARLTLGGRSQAFDEQRLRTSLVRQFSDRERRIRSAIVRAERDKNKSSSLRARVRLMQLFSRMIEIGLEDKVPRWAKNQLAAIRNVGGDIDGDSFGKNTSIQKK